MSRELESLRRLAKRIRELRAEGCLPSLEHFRDAVGRALAALDDPDKLTPEDKEDLLELLAEIQRTARQQNEWDNLPLATYTVQ